MKDLEELQIVEATDDDSVIGAWLMNLAFDDMSPYLFGTTSLSKIQKYYRELWLNKNNRMSRRFSYVIRDKGKAVALISCYEGSLTNKLFLPSFFAFVKINPGLIKYIFTHLNYLFSIMTAPEANKDEFYIFMLAVLPEYQNKGIGSRLLKFAEQKAREKNFKKVSLLVSAKNEGGIRFYERNGFKKVMLINKKPINNYKMVKDLD